ncbi:TIR domain-containing protein [Chloroflexota bacterium]
MGGGGSYIGDNDINALDRIPRKTIRESDQPERRNVFISFAAEDVALVNFLRGQAKNENSNLDFIDRSLQEPYKSENEEYIRRGIRERIRQTSVTVCFLTDNTAQSEWVDWEIRESVNLGKGVIAVYQGEKPPSNLPSVIRELNIRLVTWKQAELTAAIEQSAEERIQ